MNLLPLLTPLLVLLQSGAPAAPKMDLRLFAAADSVAPGGKVDLAVEIKLEKDWHIYYPVHLDAGWPTLLTFSFADDSGEKPAATFGPVRFPPPNLGEMFGFEYLAYHDTLVLLTEMTVDPALPPDKPLKLRLKVDGTVCHDQKGCIPAKLYAALDLPIKKGTGQPANAELFSKAGADRLKSLADAQWTSGSKVEVAKVDLKLNEPNELIATIRVKPGHHIQDRDPGVEGLIGTRLLVEPITGVKFDEAIWPAPKIRDVQGIGKVRELGGEFKIRIPFTVNDSKFVAGDVYQRVLLYAQCCTDAGQCYPPEFSEGVIRYKVESPNASADPWFNGHGSWLPRITPNVKSVLAGGDIDAATAANAHVLDRASAPGGESGSLWQMLLFGFLGGLILNVMPCVLPVISIKVLGFVKQAQEDPGRVFRLGLAFSAGVMVWFWLFAFLASKQIIVLQEPLVVVALVAILFLMALNLFGVFEITLPGAAAGVLDSAASHEGYVGSFFKGFLATILGTACSAPLLVGALAYTLTQPPIVGYAIYSSAGVGMALPYLLLSANPRWLKFVPKPGPWMLTFKQSMGFVILGTIVWLLFSLDKQLGGRGVVWTLGFLGFLGLAGWLVGLSTPLWSAARRWSVWGAGLTSAVFGFWLCLVYLYDGNSLISNSQEVSEHRVFSDGELNAVITAVRASDWKRIPWQHYEPGLAEALAAHGHTVYVDYTADWCGTCKANKAVALEIDSTRKLMHEMGVIPIEADYTRKNPDITLDLQRFGYSGVPMNLVYPANKPQSVILMSTALLPGGSQVKAALEQAGPSVGAGEATAAAPSPAGVPSR